MSGLHSLICIGALAIVWSVCGSKAIAESPATVQVTTGTSGEASQIETLKQRVRELENQLQFSEHLTLLDSPEHGNFVPFITWVKIDKKKGGFFLPASFPKPGDPISLPLPWTKFRVAGRTFIVFPADLEGSAHVKVGRSLPQTGPVFKIDSGTEMTEQ